MTDAIMDDAKRLYAGIVKQIADLQSDIIAMEQKQRQVVALLVVQENEERKTGYFYESAVKTLESLRVMYANELKEYRKELESRK